MTFAIGRLHDSRKEGTAFAVSPTLVLTAFHCIGDEDTGSVTTPEVSIWFPKTADPISAVYKEGEGDARSDYAILHLQSPLPEGLEIVPLLLQARPFDIWRSCGYPPAILKHELSWVAGRVTATADEATIYKEPAIQLSCNEAADGYPIGGLSGAPVLISEPEMAIGLVRWNPPNPLAPGQGIGGIVYACPIRSIIDSQGWLEKEVELYSEAQGAAQGYLAEVARPTYPALDEDTQYLIHAREILLGWRIRYSSQKETLQLAARKARQWSREVPARFDDEVAEVVDLAARVAQDFQSVPIGELEAAKSYGLSVHPTVLWGHAASSVLATHSMYGPGRDDAMKAIDEQKAKLGIPVSEVPDRYSFEMVARVLESADAMARFRLDSLPQGFIHDVGSGPTGSIPSDQTLLLASIDQDPRLHLMTVGQEPVLHGAFAARKRALYPLCARRNAFGSVDLVAHDHQYIYRWFESSQYPTNQYLREGRILDAAFISPSAEADVIMIDTEGIVWRLKANGQHEIAFRFPGNSGLRSARIWIDPLKPERWHAIAITDAYELISQSLAAPMANPSKKPLWDELPFLGSPEHGVWWSSNCYVSLHELDGFPCVVVSRQAQEGEGIHFLDPLSLQPLRQPLFIEGFVGDMVIAAGRWLAVFFLQKGEQILPRIALWDLQTESEKPLEELFPRFGDVYHPFVTSQTADAFEVMFVLRLFDSDATYWLCRYSWPSGEVEELAEYSDLRILPVSRGSETGKDPRNEYPSQVENRA